MIGFNWLAIHTNLHSSAPEKRVVFVNEDGRVRLTTSWGSEWLLNCSNSLPEVAWPLEWHVITDAIIDWEGLCTHCFHCPAGWYEEYSACNWTKGPIQFVHLAIVLLYQRNCDYWSNERPNSNLVCSLFFSLVQCAVSETQIVIWTTTAMSISMLLLTEWCFFTVSWPNKCITLHTRQYLLPGINTPLHC